MKKLLLTLLAGLAAVAVWPSVVSCGPVSRLPSEAATGRVAGRVTFAGLPCGPAVETRTPPCSGPYAGFEIVIHEVATGSEALRVVTGEDGRYQAVLPAGRFEIKLPAISGPPRTVPITIIAGATTQVDVQVDTGVR